MKFLNLILIAKYVLVLAQGDNCTNSCPTEGVCPQILLWLQDDQYCFQNQTNKSVDCSYEEYYFYKNFKQQINKKGNYVVHFTFFDYKSYEKILEIQSINNESFNITIFRSKSNCEQLQLTSKNSSLKLILAPDDHQMRIQVTSNSSTNITFNWEYNYKFTFSKFFENFSILILAGICVLIYLILKLIDLFLRIIVFIYEKITFNYKNPTTLDNEDPTRTRLQIQEDKVCSTRASLEIRNTNQEEQQ